MAFCIPIVPMVIWFVILAVERASEVMLPLWLIFAIYLFFMAIASGAAVFVIDTPIRSQLTKASQKYLKFSYRSDISNLHFSLGVIAAVTIGGTIGIVGGIQPPIITGDGGQPGVNVGQRVCNGVRIGASSNQTGNQTKWNADSSHTRMMPFVSDETQDKLGIAGWNGWNGSRLSCLKEIACMALEKVDAEH